MIVGAPGNDAVTALLHAARHGACILHHLPLVVSEFRLQRLLEGDRLGRDHVHQRSTLSTGKHHRIQFLLNLLVTTRHDQPAARTAQRLVCGRCRHIRDRHRIRIQARGNQACDVGDIDEQVGADLIGDGAQPLPVHYA